MLSSALAALQQPRQLAEVVQEFVPWPLLCQTSEQGCFGAATLQTLKDALGRVLDQLYVARLTAATVVCHAKTVVSCRWLMARGRRQRQHVYGATTPAGPTSDTVMDRWFILWWGV